MGKIADGSGTAVQRCRRSRCLDRLRTPWERERAAAAKQTLQQGGRGVTPLGGLRSRRQPGNSPARSGCEA